MPNSLPIAPGIILEGLGEWLGATCLAPGLIHIFLAFAASWPVQGGSRSFLEVEFEKCDLPFARRVALGGSGSEGPKNVEKIKFSE